MRRVPLLLPLAVLGLVAGCGGDPAAKPAERSTRPVAPASSTAQPSDAAAFQWQNPAIAESSGLAVSPDGTFWTMNDAGKPAVVFGVDAAGKTVNQVRVGAEQTDWEDLAIANGLVYVADTGDAYLENKKKGLGPRREIAVLRFSLPDKPSATPTDAEDLQTWRASFDTPFVPNVESILVAPGTGQVYLVTKVEQPGKPAEVWKLPANPTTRGVNALQRIATIDKTKLSGGAWSADGKLVALRDATTAYIWKAGASADISKVFTHPPTEVPLPRQRQGEGMTFSQDGHALLVSSEGHGSEVWRVPLPAAL